MRTGDIMRLDNKAFYALYGRNAELYSQMLRNGTATEGFGSGISICDDTNMCSEVFRYQCIYLSGLYGSGSSDKRKLTDLNSGDNISGLIFNWGGNGLSLVDGKITFFIFNSVPGSGGATINVVCGDFSVFGINSKAFVLLFQNNSTCQFVYLDGNADELASMFGSTVVGSPIQGWNNTSFSVPDNMTIEFGPFDGFISAKEYLSTSTTYGFDLATI